MNIPNTARGLPPLPTPMAIVSGAIRTLAILRTGCRALAILQDPATGDVYTAILFYDPGGALRRVGHFYFRCGPRGLDDVAELLAIARAAL